MSENFIVKVDGVERFPCTTLVNAAKLVTEIGKSVPDVTAELVMPDGETLNSPTYPEALAFLAAKGYTVRAKGEKATAAEPAPAKPAATRKVTARTKPAATTKASATAAATKTTTPRKRVAAARK